MQKLQNCKTNFKSIKKNSKIAKRKKKRKNTKMKQKIIYDAALKMNIRLTDAESKERREGAHEWVGVAKEDEHTGRPSQHQRAVVQQQGVDTLKVS